MPSLGLGLGLGFTRRPRPSGYPAGTLLISDTFTDADTTALSAHTIAPTNLPGNGWVQLGSVAHTVQTNKVQRSSSFSAAGYAVEIGQAPVKVRATMTDATNFGGAEVGVFIRYQSDANYWLAARILTGGVNTVKLIEVSGGVLSMRASIADNPTTIANWAEVEDGGSQLTIRNELGNSASYTSSFLAAVTKCGIGKDSSYSSGISTWDDFTVTAT